MKTHSLATAATWAAALAASVTLAACQPERTAGAPDVRPDGTTMSEQARSHAADAAITVAVNAALAKDSQLSALSIDVDTVDGKVVLDGRAPDDAARDRATVLAQAVDGVRSVDNRLSVQPTS